MFNEPHVSGRPFEMQQNTQYFRSTRIGSFDVRVLQCNYNRRDGLASRLLVERWTHRGCEEVEPQVRITETAGAAVCHTGKCSQSYMYVLNVVRVRERGARVLLHPRAFRRRWIVLDLHTSWGGGQFRHPDFPKSLGNSENP